MKHPGRIYRIAAVLAASAAIFAAVAVAQIGGTDTDVITGIEPWPNVTQAGDQVAVNGQTVVVAYNDSLGGASTPVTYTGLSVSTDGGATFNRIFPPPWSSTEATYGSPQLVYDKKLGLFFAGTLATECNGAVQLWTSANGTSWAVGACPHLGLSDDRPSLAVDNNVTSPHYGRLYLTFNDFTMSGTVWATHSDDGTAWTAPVQITSGFQRDLRVAVASDGTVIQATMDEHGGAFNPRTNYAYRSTDGGATFGSAIPQGADYAAAGDALASDPSLTKFNGATSTGGWRNYGTGDLAAGSGGVAIEAFVEHGLPANGPDGGDIYVVRSANNGSTWSTPVRVDGDPGAKAQWMPSISGDGQTFLLAWYDRRNTTDGVNYERWGMFTTNGGGTWSTPDRISDVLIPQPEQPDPSVVGDFAGDYMRDVFANNTFYDAWTDGRRTVLDHGGAPHNQMDVEVDRIVVSPPTATEIVQLAGRASPHAVTLTWRTASESHIAGFDIRRGGVKLNRSLIRAAGTPGGARYRFVDRHPLRLHAVYELELVRPDGTRAVAGTVRI
jgi:hypothetical protein